MNQSLKIFAYSLAGAGLLAMNILASTACTAEATAGSGSAAGGSSGGSTAAGGSTTAGGSSAGGSSAGGDTGAGGDAAGGSGGLTGAGIGQRFAEAVAAMDEAKCAACVDGLSGDASGGMVMCSGLSAACDGDTECKAMVEQVGANRGTAAMDPADCWVVNAIGSSPNDTTNQFGTCVAEKCGAECGGLTAGFASTCP